MVIPLLALAPRTSLKSSELKHLLTRTKISARRVRPDPIEFHYANSNTYYDRASNKRKKPLSTNESSIAKRTNLLERRMLSIKKRQQKKQLVWKL